MPPRRRSSRGSNVYPIGSLAEAVGFLSGQVDMDPKSIDLDEVFRQLSHNEDDFVDVKGQDYAKRALLIAAAGSHNMLMIGPPGTGKTLLAKRLPTILPPLTPAESLETTRIYSAMGLLKAGQPLMAIRPFRPPHHSVSDAGLVGGGDDAAAGRDLAWRIKACCSSMRCPSSTARRSRCSASRWKRASVTISRALAEHDVSGRVHPGGRHEPVPVRVSVRPAACV